MTAITAMAPGAAVVSASCASDMAEIGVENYSYAFALNRFRPLFDRWGEWHELTRPESRAEFRLRQLRDDFVPFHLAFAPPHSAYLCRSSVNAAFVFWEFPDLPHDHARLNPRQDWARVASQLDRILTASNFTRDAFRRCGRPVDVIPVPVPEDRFEMSPWTYEHTHRINVPCHLLARANEQPHDNPWVSAPQPPLPPGSDTLQARARRLYRATLRRCLPGFVIRGVQHAYRGMFRMLGISNEVMHIPVPMSPVLDLSGVVYLHVANPFDPRKNWRDLLSAYLLSLGDRNDATLVLKLVTPEELAPLALRRVHSHYRSLGVKHTCKLAIVSQYLAESDMRTLLQASTYYATATRAEGANLPLMDALAAGRPALSPAHTAMADYFDDSLGWVVPSTREPAPFPLGDGSLQTSWHRVDWEALHAMFRESYEIAKSRGRYTELSHRARLRMQEYASLESVWPAFCTSMEALTQLARERA